MPDISPQPRCVALLMGAITDVNRMPASLNSCSLAAYHHSCPSGPIRLAALPSEARRANAGEPDLPPATGPVGGLVQPVPASSTGRRR